ncbi:hypothetical protein [Pedobacter sp. BS3]|uniref:hypothetical protein n=1 Tax=Pedobacter sp. BS3 TaxID=2567937 RepID=UPI0011EE5BE9|nr:hypothetical protein [Pedobacter sp. BS3]
MDTAGKRNPKNKDFQLWQQDNRPIQLSTPEMARQRLEYIHANPVKEGLVYAPEHYCYSSAIDHAGSKGKIDIEFLY